MNKVNLTASFVQKYKKGNKLDIHIKKKNRGKFTESAKRHGMSVQQYASKVLSDPSSPSYLRKRAQFAKNAAKWHMNGGILAQQGTKLLPLAIQENQPQVVQRYAALLDNGINAQPAFDTAHLSYTVEDNRPGHYYSFGKRSNNINTWQKQATDSLTNGRYKQLNNTLNFQQFKKVLKSKGYNARPNFWNTEINRGRNLDKEKVNLFNKEHKLPLITGVNINTSNLV